MQSKVAIFFLNFMIIFQVYLLNAFLKVFLSFHAIILVDEQYLCPS